MKTDLLNDTDQVQQGRKEEALRMARRALTRRFGGLEHRLSLAVEQKDSAEGKPRL